MQITYHVPSTDNLQYTFMYQEKTYAIHTYLHFFMYQGLKDVTHASKLLVPGAKCIQFIVCENM